jgi:hypothetical protein
MWLISSDDSVATTHIAGHLQLVQPSVVSASKCRVAAFSAPTRRVFESTDVLQLQTRATWNCEWGMAQFPSITWCNSGISTIDVLCSLAMIKDPVYP